MAKKKKFENDQVENQITKIVIDSEYQTAKTNKDNAITGYESLLDMLECRRNEKDYDWMSDNFIPEMNSIILTDCSQWANQYFQSRDFIEVKLDGESPEEMQKARGAKKLINKTLNLRDIYYYPKYMRARMINALFGEVYILSRWEQDIDSFKVKQKQRVRTGKDIAGLPITTTTQIPTFEDKEVEVTKFKIKKDQFNFEVLDPRNVFTDNKYCYSAQQRDWIIVRYESSYEELKNNEERNEYINLDRVRDAIKRPEETETSRDSYNKNQNNTPLTNTPVKSFDVLDRYGLFWAIPEDNLGAYPVEAKPGISESGEVLEGAQLLEMIITYALIGNQKIMIRFRPTDCIDNLGNPFKPIAKGICYIHPAHDMGLSDGKNMRELQICVNDVWNMGQDRVKLATLPTFIGRKYSLEDNSTVYMEPEHVIEVEDPGDLKELQIRDNINGAIQSLGILTSKMQQVTSIYPTTMGGLPDKASTTATAVAGADSRTNARANYKSLTFEYTFLQEFYWLILQMTHRFMKSETAIRIMGDDAYYFDANANYTYSPVSSNIESEYNKNKKISQLDQNIGRLSGLVKGLPELIPIIAKMQAMIFTLQGEENQEFGHLIDQLVKAKYKEGDKDNPEAPKDMKDSPTSNQNGQEISPMEGAAREGVMPAGGGIK